MRSTSWSEILTSALGAATEAVWIGAAVALVTSQSGPASMAYAAAVLFAAAVLARWAGAGGGPTRASRAAAVALPLIAGGALFAATRSWAGPHIALNAVAAVVYAAVLVLLGAALGRESVSPHAAVLRAVRGFALLCAVFAFAAVSGHTPAWAGGAVVAVLMSGALLVATARYQTLAATVAPADRAPAWRWLLAVVGVLLLIVAVGALLGLVLRVDVLLWALSLAGGGLRYLLQLLAFGVGWAGAGLLRALSWLVSLFDLHGLPTPEPPQAPDANAVTPRRAPQTGAWGLARLVALVAAAVLAVGLALVLVALALRRVRRVTSADVQEEREAVVTLRAAAGGAAAQLGRRLRRLVPRRPTARTPAELVRRRYRELERRLARSGCARPPGTTVRAYLASVPSAAQATQLAAAGEIAAVYELARYSDRTVDDAVARRFGAATEAFGVAAAAGVTGP